MIQNLYNYAVSLSLSLLSSQSATYLLSHCVNQSHNQQCYPSKLRKDLKTGRRDWSALWTRMRITRTLSGATEI